MDRCRQQVASAAGSVGMQGTSGSPGKGTGSPGRGASSPGGPGREPKAAHGQHGEGRGKPGGVGAWAGARLPEYFFNFKKIIKNR